MSKKTLIIIIIFFLILAISSWFLVSQKIGPMEEVSVEENTNNGFFNRFFPFGDNDNDDSDRNVEVVESAYVGVDVNSPSINLISGRTEKLQLQQLTSSAISGAVSIESGDASTSTMEVNVRYIERSTGNIYEINPNTLNIKRLTNTTIPAIYETLWNKSGDKFILRYLNENNVIKTFIGKISKSISPTSTSTENIDIGEISGSFITDDISYLVSSPDSETLVYLEPSRFGVSGINIDFSGNLIGKIFDSQFSEWIIEWPNEKTFALTTKASSVADGYLYFVDSENGEFTKILGNIKGLTTSISPSAEILLYSESSINDFTLNSFSIAERTSERLSVTTLPEKCTWSSIRDSVVYCGASSDIPNGSYPDIWYQGSVLFEDDIWEIDVKRNVVRIIVSPQSLVGETIDVINPFLSDNEEYLFFTNKKDLTLWSLKLNN